MRLRAYLVETLLGDDSAVDEDEWGWLLWTNVFLA